MSETTCPHNEILDGLCFQCGVPREEIESTALAAARAEIERLKDTRIGSHGEGCWNWGRSHYECAVRQLAAQSRLVAGLQERVRELESDLEPPVCRLQFPDGTVPGNVREAAEGWKEWADEFRARAAAAALTREGE